MENIFEVVKRNLYLALDLTSNYFMIADESFNIVHMNKPCKDFFRIREKELKLVYPGFSSENIIGQNISRFHSPDVHERALKVLEGLHSRREDPDVSISNKITVAGFTFKQLIKPIVSEGLFIGYSIEWSDITENEIVKNRLKESMLMAGLVDLCPIGLIVFSPTKGPIMVNDSFCKFTGYEKEMLLGQKWDKEVLIPDKHANADEAAYKKVLSTGVGITYEKSYKTKSGKEIPVLFSCNKFEGMKGEDDYLLGAVIDITEIKEKEFRWKAILDSSEQGVIVIDETTAAVEINDAGKKVFGENPDWKKDSWRRVYKSIRNKTFLKGI
jgi:PAS domain S-box-containing protein